jgi:cell division protein FtsZ
MTNDNNIPQAAGPTAAIKPLSIKVIGVGGAGANAVDHMAKGALPGVLFAVTHTNQRALENTTTTEKLLLGSNLMRGLGTGGDPELGRAAAEEGAEHLRKLCQGSDLVFIIGGLGGGTATGVAPVLARVAKDSGALVLAIVTLPFEFEGARRARQAQFGLQQLKAAADGVVCLPHQKVVMLLDQHTSLVETFNFSNELLAQGVRGVWQMLTRRGLINVDFADLCAVLRGRHAESCFATAQSEGEDRAREVMETLLSNPLLQGGQILADADAVLVSIVGGLDLTMTDVCKVMEQVNRQAENAQVVMGAAIEDDYQKRLSVTIVVSRRNQEPSRLEHPPLKTSLTAESNHPGDTVGSCIAGPPVHRSASRFVPPPPELTPERRDELFAQQTGPSKRPRKSRSPWRQGQLPLEIVSKGRFEKSEPTIYQGEDLDVPTYIRRGIALN